MFWLLQSGLIKVRFGGSIKVLIDTYERAIAHYPASNHFHSNEVHNNFGTVLYDMGDIAKAKSAWEQALLYLPSDKMTRRDNVFFSPITSSIVAP